MGRFLAIVIILVAAAAAINYFTSGEDQDILGQPAGADEQPASQPPADTSPPDIVLDGDETSGDQPAADGPALGAPTGEPTPTTTAQTDEAATTDADNSGSTDESATETPAAQSPSVQIVEEEVLLGSDELTSGIRGEGSLSVEEIQAWLDDPRNHHVLKPELPLGLAAGAMQIVGIDENPLTRAKIELGRQLFFDPRLSGDQSITCASCHDPEYGYAKNTQFGVGVAGQTGNRNSPVAYNRILSGPQFWDGRAASLEEQAIGPIANPIEMANTHEAAVDSIQQVEGYRVQFERIFDDGVNIENAAKAIASFERALVTGPTPWDHYDKLASFTELFEADVEEFESLSEEEIAELEEEDIELYELYQEYAELKKASEENPISEAAIRGGKLFFSDKANCTACHVGANFTDEKYHNLGVGMDVDEPDLGRYVVTGEEVDRGAFKTPTIRNIGQTAPYMHDGSQKTLEEVVEWYVKGGHPNPHLSDKIKKLDLTDQDKADLVAFMKELTGDLPKVETARLPN